MVKTLTVLVLTLCFAAPALAQSDDYPRIETSFGYANINLFDGHHSGFTNQSGLNLTRWLGIENYMGYYAVGGGTSLFADAFGGRLTARQFPHIVPYIGAGIGAGYLSNSSLGVSSGSMLATRVGGGVDIPINDTISWKVDISRLSLHSGEWISGTNFATGIVLNLGN